ncbi:kinase-like domain-containing protein [Gloeopeniophorella convolvens]|nr:kinase-like domain-containing protein [Gloeopeniophorella convolvens]
MIEDDILGDRHKSAGRGPPLTVKIDEQSGASPSQTSQLKSSTSSGGGVTLIPNNFPPPPKHPPPSPPLPHWGARTPTSRHSSRKPLKQDATFQDSWASRPNPEEVLDRLEDFFPDHDVDKPVIEASSGGTSPTTAESAAVPLPSSKPSDKRSRHKKSIRVVAEEHNLRQDRSSRLQSSSAANVFRKRSTKLWDSRVEEVTPGQLMAMPSIPDSPSPGAPAPRPIFKWVRGELIGRGNFGRVYLALNATTGEMIAVKQVEIPRTASDKNDTRQVTVVEALKLESETLKDLDHPHIVQYLGFEETPTFLSIFLEYVPGGSVGSCLRKYGRFEENVTKYFSEQILSGLEYLHSKGILHRDLKADNILVEKTGICKISDFGISKRTDDINEQNVLTAMQGTVFWMAPEVVNTGKRGYNAKVDIWSVGCVVLEMWAGERPWRKEEAMAVIVKLYSSKQAPPIPSGVTLSPQADDFRKRCFAVNPDERPSAAELRKHPYLGRPPGWVFSDFTGSSEVTRPNDSDDY